MTVLVTILTRSRRRYVNYTTTQTTQQPYPSLPPSLTPSSTNQTYSVPHDPVEGVAQPLPGRQRAGVHVGLDAFAVRSTGRAPAARGCCLHQRDDDDDDGAWEDPVTRLSAAGGNLGGRKEMRVVVGGLGRGVLVHIAW